MLKIIIPLLFLAVFGIYLYARRNYSEEIRTFIDILLLFALCAIIAGIFRYFGDGDPVRDHKRVLPEIIPESCHEEDGK